MFKEGVPRHTQITERLRDQIEDGTFEVNEKLPSENELCKKFDVSRVTVRKALQTLENEQLIYRSQGLGSFVCDDRPRQSFIQLTDFVEDMRRAGMEASSEVIQFTPVSTPDSIAPRLNIDSDSTIMRLDRLRMGDGKPIAFDVTWMPMFYGQLLEGYELKDKTIYGILEQDYDIPIEKGYYRIEAANADKYLGKHLNIYKGTALLLIDRLSLTVGEKPVYYQKRYYRSDRIVYELMAERESGSGDTPDKQMPLREFVPVFKTKE